MITPRQTRLHRVQTLHDVQRVLWSLVDDRDPFVARSSVVLVPSRAAAAALRHTLETLACRAAGDSGADVVLALPDLATRTEWYEQLYERLAEAPPLVNEFEREVMMGAAARQAAEAGAAPPFRLRPGIVTEIVRLYDELHRLRRGVADFERLMTADLEGDADTDRGACRLLEQTRFLAGTFRGYEARLACPPRLDEHRLREWLLEHPSRLPYTHVVVAMADRASEPGGLWPADFDLLTRLPGLTRIDVVATEGILAAGFHERVHDLLPGIEERRGGTVAGGERGPEEAGPVLVAPAEQAELHFKHRDREEELASIARALKEPRADRTLGRTAIVFRRPLPYIYLARLVFDAAGIPHQTHDALPLAAEPYAAALDLVLECVSSDFGRAPLTALLRSPHFAFVNGRRPAGRAVSAFDRRLGDLGYLSGLNELGALLERWSVPIPGVGGRSVAAHGVVRAVQAMTGELAAFAAPAPASQHLDRLSAFLRRYDHPLAIGDPLRERHLRARAAIHAALVLLGDACRAIDDRTVGFVELSASVRRWIEGQTFAPRAGSDGVHLVSAEAARFGEFDQVHLVGLVDTEWPDRTPRSIFYPPFLLRQLGWPGESDHLNCAQAGFRDLLRLARRETSVSTFSLEDDAIVGASVYLDDLESARMPVNRRPTDPRSRIFPDEALSEDPVTAEPLGGDAAGWLALRQSRSAPSDPAFHGSAGGASRESYAVGALETYLECPFKFFARHVLRLEEEDDDEEARRARRQGQFLHRVFQAFFLEWGETGRGAITLESLDEARILFARTVAPQLDALSEDEAALERTRLFGSAAAEGLAEIVFRIEAESAAVVLERLLEYRLAGPFELEAQGRRRRVSLNGIADRIDLLNDGTLRVIDYKAGRPPNPKRMLQVPLYTLCAARQLEGRHGRSWEPGDGGYIAFRDARRFVAMGSVGSLGKALEDAQARALTAVDGIEAGEFPPTPLEPFGCTFCRYAGVCRKDYVGDE